MTKAQRFKTRYIVIVWAAAAVLSAVALCFSGVIWFNDIVIPKVAVKGIDVSHYQGRIDWEKAGETGVMFAYIKATEGMSNQDDYFKRNWKGAEKAGILSGAYHYFTLTSSGRQQAENFINIVPKEEGRLPPAVDIEEEGRSDKYDYLKELKILIGKLEDHYGKKPVLYVSYTTYEKYIKGLFDGYPIWIQSTILPPTLGEEWTIWQYCDRRRLGGIRGYADGDVFNGSIEELKSLAEGK